MRACMPHCCSHVAHVCPHIWPCMRVCMPYCCPHIWPMYARTHAPLLLLCDPCMLPYMAHVCAHACPIDALIYGPCMSPLLLQNMAYSYPYMLYIANAKRLVQIRHKAWRFLTAFLIVLIFVPLNGACIRAYIGHMGAAIGHACAHTWAIYGGTHGSHGSSNGACMRAYMGHIWGHTWATWEQQWGIHGRIYGPHGSSIRACIRAYIGHMGAAMGHTCAHT